MIDDACSFKGEKGRMRERGDKERIEQWRKKKRLLTEKHSETVAHGDERMTKSQSVVTG